MMEAHPDVQLCYPQLHNSSCKKPSPDLPNTVFLNVVLPVVALITVVLNLLVIISVSHFRQLQTPTNILLLSLAVSDLLVGLLLIPTEIYRKGFCWKIGHFVCSIYFYLICSIVISSILTIVLISIDRFMAISDPLRYPLRVTANRARLCVGLCWVYCTLYSGIVTSEDLLNPGKHISCEGQCNTVINLIVGIVDVFMSFIVPVSAIIVLYVRVFLVAVSQARALRSVVTADTRQHLVSHNKWKSELKAARTLGVLVIIYLICFFPYFCVVLTGNTSPNASLVVFLFYFNSCVNPLIYALFYRWFRKAVRIIVTMQILKPSSCEANVL